MRFLVPALLVAAACAAPQAPLPMPALDPRLQYLDSESHNVFSMTVDVGGSVLVLPAQELCSGASCLFTLPKGTPVHLEAHAEPGYRFVGWQGACSDREPNCSVTLDSSELAVARFELKPKALAAGAQGEGAVTASR